MCIVPNYCKDQSLEWKNQNCVITVSDYENLPIISFLQLRDIIYIPQQNPDFFLIPKNWQNIFVNMSGIRSFLYLTLCDKERHKIALICPSQEPEGRVCGALNFY